MTVRIETSTTRNLCCHKRMACDPQRVTLKEVIDVIAREFHEIDRVLVQAAVTVANSRYASRAAHGNRNALIERAARDRLHAVIAR
jgi:hypothetical protein